MKHEGRSNKVYLAHASECIDSVITYTSEGKEAFLADRKTRDAVLRNLEIHGQCLKDAGIEALEIRHPAIRWRRIADFRNVLAHQYIGVDDLLVWTIVAGQLPPLRIAINQSLSELQQ